MFTHQRTLALLFLSWSFRSVYAQDSLIQSEVVEAVRAGWDSWRLEVDFVGTYEFRQGTLDDAGTHDLDDLLIEPLDKSLLPVIATGFVAKVDTWYRVTRDYTEDPAHVEAPPHMMLSAPDQSSESLFMTKNRDEDEMVNGTLWAIYNPAYEDQSDVLRLGRIIEGQGDSTHPIALPGILLTATTPILPVPGRFGGFPLEPVPAFESSDFEVLRTENDTIRLTARRESNSGRRLYSIEWFLGGVYPTIREVSLVVEEEEGSRETKVVIGDYRDSEEGLAVPAHIRHVSRRSTGPIRIKDWYSTDIGERLPTNEDFDVRFTDSVILLGMKDPQSVRNSGVFRFTSYSPDDLHFEPGSQPPAGSFPIIIANESDGSTAWRLVFLGATALIAFVVAVSLYVARRRPGMG